MGKGFDEGIGACVQGLVNDIYRPQFWIDVEAGVSYLTEKASPEAASRWHEEVRATVRRVENQPDLGRLRRDLTPPRNQELNRAPSLTLPAVLYLARRHDRNLANQARHDGFAATVRWKAAGGVTAAQKGVVRMSCFWGMPFTPVEGACGFALVLALSQMREHGLGPFGRADLHPRRNPLDRQGRFAPQPGGDGSKDEG